jgi:hypothetical protein
MIHLAGISEEPSRTARAAPVRAEPLSDLSAAAQEWFAPKASRDFHVSRFYRMQGVPYGERFRQPCYLAPCACAHRSFRTPLEFVQFMKRHSRKKAKIINEIVRNLALKPLTFSICYRDRRKL